MIDTHCHLLPGIDDGPRDRAQALQLAAGLSRVGVSQVVCTPHFSRRFPTDHERALDLADELVAELRTAGIELQLAVAAELSPAMALEASDTELQQRRIGSRHVLVELVRETPVAVVGLIGDRLADLGLAPILAHPERCPAVRDQPHLLDAARARGALVQVVAPSLAAEPHSATTRSAWRLVRSGRVDLLASDSHRPAHAGRLRGALAKVGAELGAATVDALVRSNPQRLLESRVRPR